MIKYTAKDIVERAEQLSDLQNSDFISDSEKSALLNEAWSSLYQKIVNANDRTFIKSISAYDGMKLPKDFYQLSSLYVTKDKRQIERVNSSQMQGYNITNDILLLSHEYDDVEITLEYFPVPKTIFYNSGKKENKSFVENPKILVDDDVYLATDNNLYSYSNDSVIASFTEISGIHLKNGVLTYADNAKSFYDYSNNLVESKALPFVIKGNEVTYDTIRSYEDLGDYLAVVMDDAEQVLYFVGNDYKLYDKDFNEILNNGTAFNLSLSTLYCRADGLYIAANGANNVIRVLGDVVERFPLNLYSFCCFVDGNDIIVSFNNGYYKMAYGFSTLLDYPNNIYYTILAYMLAVSFKIKQNGDPALLNAQLDKASNQFFDSLNRDSNQFYIMKDVYRNGRGRIW